ETIVVDWGLATTFVSPGTTAEPSNDDSGLRISVPELDGPPENGRITGTVQYMPPEQALGRHDEMYEASDVFSLGATLYTLLVNQPMYSGTKMAEVLKLAQQRQAVPARQVNSRVPAALDAIVEKATARAPADRYQTARQLADDIEAFLADEPVSARPDPFADRVRRWLRHHRAWAMSALAAIFVAIVGLSAVAAVLSVKNAEVAAERDVAQQNLESARQAVRQSLVMVSEDPQLKEEGMLALRHRLLTAPEGYYQKFLTQSPDDPHLKAEQAEWLLLLSRASYDAKTRAEALQNVRRAEEIYQSLVAAVPTNDEYLNGLARAQNLLGVFLKDTGKMQEAHDQFTAAVGMAERHLAADAAASPITLVAALANLAETNIYFDDRVAATQLLRRAIELRDKGLANFPQDGPLMRTNPQEILIGVLYDNGKIAEALDMSESYIRELRSFEPAADEANEMRYTLARQIQLQAEVLNAKGLPHRAMTVYREANDVVQRLLAVSPGNTRYQSLASELNIRLLQPADVSVFLADMGQISKQHDESDARVTRAIERDPDVLQNHVDLCMIRLESAGLEFQVPNIAAAKTKIANAQQAIESAIARFGNHRTLSWLQSYLFAFQAQLRQQDGQHAEADRLLAHADEAFRAGKSQATTVPEEFRRVEIESVAMDLALMQEDADRAAVALQRMDDALAQVAEEYKNTPAYRRTVAQRYTLDARLLLLKGDSEAADHSLVEAIQVREKIVADFPDEPLYRTELFQAHTGAGTSIAQRELNRSAADSDSGIDMDRIQLVFGHLRAALEQIDNLDPQTLSVAFLESVVNVRQEITSGMFLQLIENDEIVHELRAAIRIYRGLLERTGHAKYIVGIATYELRLAQHLDNEESLTITNQAAASLGRYVAEFPDDESAREVLWNVHTIQGEYYWDQGRYEEARQSFEHAAEMNGVNDPTHARIRLANVHAIMGDYGTAIDLLRHTESIPEMTGVDWYNVGCGYALAVDAARADMRLTDGGRKELTETYALAAIRALYHAKDLGDFADVDDLEYLRDGDESLRSLRDRDDFREFVQEVQQSLDGGEQNSE
ncbi:MAG: hypothetical protein KDA99_23565, partial [Planctomycetales bacterium]|nr:hypothetical protein [Planctomycetales bacterium]